MSAKSRRSYKGAAVEALLGSGGVSSSTQTSISLSTSPSTWPTGKFFVVVAPGTAQEEKMCVTLSGSTMTVVDPDVSSTAASTNGRGADDTTARTTIAGGSRVYPVATAQDFDEANELTSTYTTQGDIVYQGSLTFTRLGIAGTAGHVLKTNAGRTAPEWGQVGEHGIANGAVTSAKILDRTIVDGDIAINTLKLVCPVGTIAPYGGDTAPTGWLLCNGSSINVAYTELRALVGANTPDLSLRVPIGAGSGVAARTSGGNRKIGTTHLPAHTHAIDHDHATFNTASGGTHTHKYSTANWNASVAVDNTTAVVATTDRYGEIRDTDTTGSSHAHAVDVPAFTGTSGDGGFANNDYFQPYYAVNYIIKHDY